MQRNDLLSDGKTIYRVLEVNKNSTLILDCVAGNMPKQVDISDISRLQSATYQDLLDQTKTIISEIENLSWRSQKLIQERYSLIAPILPVVTDKRKRNTAIDQIMHSTGISKQTIRHYLCLYLAFQDKSVLAPQDTESRHKFSQDEKNMRWALNKYYYTAHKNSLQTAYTLMLKEKYSHGGVLPEVYPSFNQFKYFYRKTRNMQTYYISRDGLSNYQRNHRPLTGDGVQSFASAVGVGMIDATVCDIYLVNDSGNLVGRPILTACIDAYSSLCMGYALSWEGGIYSLKNVAMNMIADKVDWCLQFGIHIKPEDWDCTSLPGIIVSDMGREYKSGNFEQIAELGIKIINLPPYRPELKGTVEKFFDLIQSLYKPHLKDKGVISPDYQERGARDYRKDACLTMQQFESIVLQCIVYYNCNRIIENFPYTADMLQTKVNPFASAIWNYAKNRHGANLINVSPEQLVFTFLPRTTGKFSRFGLKVNKLRYKNDSYAEEYLRGGNVTVAYNPDDVSRVWLFDNGKYIPFDLIESRYQSLALDSVVEMQDQQNKIIQNAVADNLQARVNLASHIQAVSENAIRKSDTNIKAIRHTRQKETDKSHIDHTKGIKLHE